MGEWRYLAATEDGAGNQGAAVEIPLHDVSVTRKLSTPPQLDATVPLEITQLQGAAGRPIFDEWGTGIYAEDPTGRIWGGLLINSSMQGASWTLDVAGFTYYPKGQPFTLEEDHVQVDPMDMFRYIWAHLQSLLGGQFNITLDDVKSPVRIGRPREESEEVEFVTGEGEEVEFTARGPYELNWFETLDLGSKLDDLARNTPFEWEEIHYRDAGTGKIRHHIKLGYPRLGQRRHDLRFAVGENIRVLPDVSRPGEDFATDCQVLGAGEGRDRKAGSYSIGLSRGRPRRVVCVEDKSLTSVQECTDRARREVESRQGKTTFSTVEVMNHPNARLELIELGDEVYVQGWTGWADLHHWVRVVSITMTPGGDKYVLGVVPAE